jgi:hypothetical protein
MNNDNTSAMVTDDDPFGTGRASSIRFAIAALDLCAWSFGRDKFDNMPIPYSGDFDDLVRFIDDNRAATKGLNYVTALFTNDGRRCKENACRRNWLPFDLDGVDGQGVSREALERAGEFFKTLKGVAYQTASSRPGAFKMRFVVALTHAVTDEMSKALGAHLETLTGIEGWDRSVYALSQPIYLPPVGNKLYRFDGAEVDVMHTLSLIPAPKPRVYRPRPMDKAAPDAFAFFSRNGRVRSSRMGSHSVVCPWVDSHTNGDESGTALFDPSDSNNYVGGFKCQHSHCASRTIAHVFKMMEEVVTA